MTSGTASGPGTSTESVVQTTGSPRANPFSIGLAIATVVGVVALAIAVTAIKGSIAPGTQTVGVTSVDWYGWYGDRSNLLSVTEGFTMPAYNSDDGYEEVSTSVSCAGNVTEASSGTPGFTLTLVAAPVNCYRIHEASLLVDIDSWPSTGYNGPLIISLTIVA